MDLTRETIAGVDSTGQLDEVLGLDEHLEDALWRFDSAQAPAVDAAGGVIVAGMGGSASGGRLAIGALGARLRRPMFVADGHALPGWAGPSTLVFASSYSGNTEETLSAYDDAAARGCPRIVATTGGSLAGRAREDGVPVVPIPGGFQPRAAIGYSLVAALEAAWLAGAAPSMRAEIEAAAALVEELVAEWGPDAGEDSLAKSIAVSLHGTVPVIAGAELTAAVAYRWKCQFNENAGLPAFAGALPEIDHNEVVGWPAARELGRFSAVFLQDPGAHPRDVLRTELTAEQARAGTDVVELVAPHGDTPIEHLISHVLLGDLVSLYLAVLRGKDPIDIAPIDALKAALAER